MARKLCSFTLSFNAKVALDAIKEVRKVSEITEKHKLHPMQVNLWKKQLMDGDITYVPMACGFM